MAVQSGLLRNWELLFYQLTVCFLLPTNSYKELMSWRRSFSHSIEQLWTMDTVVILLMKHSTTQLSIIASAPSISFAPVYKIISVDRLCLRYRRGSERSTVWSGWKDWWMFFPSYSNTSAPLCPYLQGRCTDCEGLPRCLYSYKPVREPPVYRGLTQ